MESKLLKIKLNKGAKGRVEELIEFMRKDIVSPRYEMEQKGYFWDSIFFSSETGDDFIYIVLKSEDFGAIMMDETALDITPFRDFYEQFRKDCWAPEMYDDIEFVHCFNKAMVFDA